MNSLPKTSAALLFLLVVVAGCGASSDLDDANQVRATVSAVQPAGETNKVVLVWRFEIADDWHLYWPGRNDSGYPPTVELQLPEGWEASKLQWPAPERHLSEGDILDHVYYKDLVLLQDVSVPENFVPQDNFEIQAEVTWLACKGMCVPGDSELVVNRISDSLDLYEQAQSELPLAWASDVLEAKWQGAALHISGPEGAELNFAPDNNSGQLENLIVDGAGPKLELRFHSKEGMVGPARGVITVDLPGESRRSFTADIPANSWQPEPSGG